MLVDSASTNPVLTHRAQHLNPVFVASWLVVNENTPPNVVVQRRQDAWVTVNVVPLDVQEGIALLAVMPATILLNERVQLGDVGLASLLALLPISELIRVMLLE